MPIKSEPGHHLEVLFTDDGRTVEVDIGDGDAGSIADTLVEAIGKDDPGEAERLIQAGLVSGGGVERHR